MIAGLKTLAVIALMTVSGCVRSDEIHHVAPVTAGPTVNLQQGPPVRPKHRSSSGFMADPCGSVVVPSRCMMDRNLRAGALCSFPSTTAWERLAGWRIRS